MSKLKIYKQKLIEKMADGELNRFGCFLVDKLILKDDAAISYLSEILSIRQGLISTTLLEKSKNNQFLNEAAATDNHQLSYRLEADLKERGWQTIEARIREESRAAFFHGERAWNQSEQFSWRRCFYWCYSLFTRPAVLMPRYGYGAALLAVVAFAVFYLQGGNNFGSESGRDNLQLISARSEFSAPSGIAAEPAGGSNNFLTGEKFADANLLIISSGHVAPQLDGGINKRVGEQSRPIIPEQILTSGDNSFLHFANNSFTLSRENSPTMGGLSDGWLDTTKELFLKNQTNDRRLRLAYNPAVNLAKRQIRSLGDSFPKHILGYANRGDYLSYSGMEPRIAPDHYPVNMPVSAMR